MKTIHILSATLLAALSLTSCSDDEPGSISGSDVEISATIGSTTRTAPYEQGDAANVFAEGDEIYMESGTQKARYVYGGGKWTFAPGSKIKWTDSQMQFSAEYPASAHGVSFTFPTDQSTAEAISSADYMTYSGIHDMTEGTIRLAMERQAARIVVTPVLADEMEGARISEVTVHADVDPGETETISAIKSFAVGGRFTALAAPTSSSISTGRKFLDIKVVFPDASEKTYVINGMRALEKGISYELSVKIGRDYAALSDISISLWTDKDELVEFANGLIRLKTAGTLTSDKINTALGLNDRLSIEGPMNGSDLKVLREYMGCKYDLEAETTPSPIHYLDMSGVNIVAGDDIYAKDFMMGQLVVPENDIIPCYIFDKLKSDSPMHIVLPRGTRTIQYGAFYGSEIDFIDLPETLEKIYVYAFAYSRIEEIKITGRYTNIAQDAFYGCTNLKRVEISEGITSIDISTIVQDLKLEYLYLPYSLSSVHIKKIATDNLNTLKIMTKPGDVLPVSKITLTKGGGDITGQHIDCDLYLCNERQGEVTNGNTWAGNTWKSITFVDGTTLK